MSTACQKCGVDLHPGLCGDCEREELKALVAALEMTLKEEQKHIVRMKDEIGELMVETAERQREACALQLHGLLKLKNATAVWVGADEIRETPLVTGDRK